MPTWDGRMSVSALADLAAELDDGVVVTDPDILASYRQDRAADPSAGTPMAVVRPTRTEEVQAVLRWASRHRIAVVPRGRAPDCPAGRPLWTAGSYCRRRRCATSPSTR